MIIRIQFLLALVVSIGLPCTSQAQLLGPLGGSGAAGEYIQLADSPFDSLDFSLGYFYFENFEDSLIVPGIAADNGGRTSVVFGPSAHDSVDEDDGTIDGSGLDGDSWFFSTGSAGVTWTFLDSVLTALPTHAGIVWTDGSGNIEFEAFDANGGSLGLLQGTHACCGTAGTTDDDRFYGAIDMGGISAIRVSNATGGIELDHLQYGNMSAEPVSIDAEFGEGTRANDLFLAENYPEPFTGTTTISFRAPTRTHVRIEVVDIMGRVVLIPFDASTPETSTEVSVDFAGLSNGLYIYRMITEHGTLSRRMVHSK